MALRSFVALACLAACGTGDAGGGAIEVSASVNRAAPDFGVVRITGLNAAERRRAAADRALLAVYAAVDSPPPGTPALAGAWHSSGDTLRFTPRFAPSEGLQLWVRVDASRLGRDSTGQRQWRFAIGNAPAPRVPEVLAIHPAMDTVPENLLRWYIEFSEPMRPGRSLQHVRLVDANGREDRTAFLDTSEELWDPTGRRLTLLFDPGRVKRGVRTNIEQGRPLVAGRRYALRILPGWPALAGRELAAPVERRLVAIAADSLGPEPARWDLHPPTLGTLDTLVVRLGEAVDHQLGQRLIAVQRSNGEPIPGTVTLRSGDREWRFAPDERWLAGRYQLIVSPELEDVAGNRPGRPFDHPLSAEPGGRAPQAPIIRRFEAVRIDR